MATQAHHRAAPTGRLKGNEWRALRILLPYLLEYKWRGAAAPPRPIVAQLADGAGPPLIKEGVGGVGPRDAVVAGAGAPPAPYRGLRPSTPPFAPLPDA